MASASQHTLVDLVCALSTLQTESVLQLVKEVVKRPQQIKGDEVRCPREQAQDSWVGMKAVTVLWTGRPGSGAVVQR